MKDDVKRIDYESKGAEDEDESCVIDHSPDEAYTEEIPCCSDDSGETEMKYEDGVAVVDKTPISTEEKDGFDRIHEWDHYTREVLNNILIAIENKQHLGYFDSIIDLETNCNLINMARDVYINQFNADGTKDRHQRTRITKEDIDKQNRGGYSVEFKERMYKLLVNVK